MITETRVVIHNGCQHKDLDIPVVPGSTYAVCGPNACGKTNFLQLNSFGLTGVVDRSWGSQSDLCKDGTKDGFVEVHLIDTTSNKSYIIKRHFISGAKNPDTLKSDGLEVVGREKVDAFLSSLFGVPMRILADLLWVRQGQITWLLSASPTSVYNFLNSLFDTSKLKKIKDILMEESSRVVMYAEDVGATARIREELKSLSIPDKSSEDALREQLKSAEESLASLPSGGVPVQFKEQEIRDAERDLKTWEGARERALKDIKEASTDPVPWLTEKHIKWLELYDRTGEDCKKKTEQASSVAVRVAKAESSYESICSRVDEADLSSDRLRRYSETLKKTKVCPVCSGRVSDEAEAEKALHRIIEPEGLSNMEDLKKEKERWNIVLDDAVSEHHKIMVTIRGLSRWLEENAERRGVIFDASSKRADHENRLKCMPELERTLKGAETALEEARRRLSRAKSLITESADVSAERDRLQTLIRELNARISSAVIERETASRRKEELERRLSELEAVSKENMKSQAFIDRLMRLREGTQNGHIPKRFLSDKVAALNEEMRSYCGMAGMPITVFLDQEDFSFRFASSSGVRSAAQLSGAQKTLCSTILQLALVRVVGPQIGLLMFDEPSVFLDAQNKGRLLSLFEAMTSILSATKTVVLMPTHDDDIKAFCGNKIELGGHHEEGIDN